MKKAKQTWLIPAAALLGAAVYLLLYGTEELRCTNVTWLLGGGDLTQHYLGWTAFRDSPWRFPAGLGSLLAWPEGCSVIFTDSIPWLAVAFKCFRAVLPADFQYFGLWGLSCFILQSVFAARLLRRFTDRAALILPAALLYTAAPAFVARMYVHSALAGHWLLLAAMDTALAGEERRGGRLLLPWALLGAACAGTHIYLLAMDGMILCGACLYELLPRRGLRRACGMLGAFLSAAALSVWLLGGFTGGSGVGGGLGEYSLNLNGFLNPQGWSALLPDLPLYAAGQGEGLAYPGLGALGFFAAGLIFGVRRRKELSGPLLLSAGAVVLLSVLFALSPTVTLGDRVLFTLPLPKKLTLLWGIFRATGRFAWVAGYVLLTGTLALLLHHARGKLLPVLLAAGLLIQGADLAEPLSTRRTLFDGAVYENTAEGSALWDAAEAAGIRHVVFRDSYLDLSGKEPYAIADWALRRGITVSGFLVSRSDRQGEEAAFRAGLSERDGSVLYVFTRGNSLCCAAYGLHYYAWGEYILGSWVPLSGQAELPASEFSGEFVIPLDNTDRLTGGELRGGARVLCEGGCSFAPDWCAGAGRYELVIEGGGLARAALSVQSCAEGFGSPLTRSEDTDTRIVGEFTLAEDVNLLRIRVENPGGGEITLRRMTLRYDGEG